MLTKLKEFDEMFCSFDERFRQAFDGLTHSHARHVWLCRKCSKE
jgi:hypothetical protein